MDGFLRSFPLRPMSVLLGLLARFGTLWVGRCECGTIAVRKDEYAMIPCAICGLPVNLGRVENGQDRRLWALVGLVEGEGVPVFAAPEGAAH